MSNRRQLCSRIFDVLTREENNPEKGFTVEQIFVFCIHKYYVETTKLYRKRKLFYVDIHMLLKRDSYGVKNRNPSELINILNSTNRSPI